MMIRLQASWEIRETAEGILELSSSTFGKSFGIKSAHPSTFLFLQTLQEGLYYPQELPVVSEKLGMEESMLDNIISKLKTHGLVIEGENPLPPQNTLYDRQLRFFRSFEDQNRSGEQLNSQLQERTVAIVGLGGYGSWIALLCARMGIKKIIGIDYDHVEITNLHRQILYDRTDLGQPKVKACEKKTRDCDPEINFIGHNLKVTTPEDLYPLIEEADLVFNPFSYLPMHKAIEHPAGLVARAALTMKKPCLTLGGSWIGPLTIPGETPCYFCAIQALGMHANLDPDHRNPYIQKRAFVLPIATCCSLAVFEASRFLSGCDQPQTLKGIMQLDILSFSNSHFLPVSRNEECSFCSSYAIQSMRCL